MRLIHARTKINCFIGIFLQKFKKKNCFIGKVTSSNGSISLVDIKWNNHHENIFQWTNRLSWHKMYFVGKSSGEKSLGKSHVKIKWSTVIMKLDGFYLYKYHIVPLTFCYIRYKHKDRHAKSWLSGPLIKWFSYFSFPCYLVDHLSLRYIKIDHFLLYVWPYVHFVLNRNIPLHKCMHVNICIYLFSHLHYIYYSKCLASITK